MSDFRSVGAFVPTNYIWDIQQLGEINIPQDLRELLVRLYQNVNIIAINLNYKDTGIYDTFEFVCGKQYFARPAQSAAIQTDDSFRMVLRLVIDFGQLPNAATKSVAHNLVNEINSNWIFVGVTGTASDTTGFNYINLPYASPVLLNNIELNADGTNVNVITGVNRTNFDTCYITLEYIKF